MREIHPDRLHDLQHFEINDTRPFLDIGTIEHTEFTLEMASGLVAALSFSGDGFGTANARITESALVAIKTLIDLAAFSARQAQAAKEA